MILLRLTRPHQWSKNAFIFAPLLFSFKFFEFNLWKSAILAALSFQFAASSIYIFNDICDIKKDILHPKKKLRPIASGKINLNLAWFYFFIFSFTSIIISVSLNTSCVKILTIYIVGNLFYSLWIKNIAIIDVIFIASGFVLRVFMGSYAIEVVTSSWIILATFLLSMFLGFGKRLNEIRSAYSSKEILNHYNVSLLDKLITCSCVATITFYALYTVEIADKYQKPNFIFTTLFVVYGLFKYLQLLYVHNEGEEPENIIIKEKSLVINSIIWLLTTLWMLK